MALTEERHRRVSLKERGCLARLSGVHDVLKFRIRASVTSIRARLVKECVGKDIGVDLQGIANLIATAAAATLGV